MSIRPLPASQRRRIAILGATGSIGSNALAVIALHPERFEVVALSAQRNIHKLLLLCQQFRPRRVVVTEPAAALTLISQLSASGLANIEVGVGADALDSIASAADVDLVIAAIVGAAGLSSTLAAASAGKTLLLANKESVVMAGPLLFAALAASGGQLIPLDSEHNAIFQCLPRDYRRNPAAHGIRRILLTASGGPFLGFSREALRQVTPEQAVRHPRWTMGRKISVDSATLMNKGLEVIEAHWLFGLAADQIDVLVHPQSLVHSLVEYVDGSLLAQLGPADMRTPIAQALAWPDRIDSGVARLDLLSAGALRFEPPDLDAFPCLALAQAALRQGPMAAVVLNAANEVAVDAFLTGQLSFVGIAEVIEASLAAVIQTNVFTLPTVLATDSEARRVASAIIQQLEKRHG